MYRIHVLELTDKATHEFSKSQPVDKSPCKLLSDDSESLAKLLPKLLEYRVGWIARVETWSQSFLHKRNIWPSFFDVTRIVSASHNPN